MTETVDSLINGVEWDEIGREVVVWEVDYDIKRVTFECRGSGDKYEILWNTTYRNWYEQALKEGSDSLHFKKIIPYYTI